MLVVSYIISSQLVPIFQIILLYVSISTQNRRKYIGLTTNCAVKITTLNCNQNNSNVIYYFFTTSQQHIKLLNLYKTSQAT